ncbi:TPA: beta strand repeat-containing protein, partial [Haemophilus influenzae]
KGINVTSDINIGNNGHLILYRGKDGDKRNGVKINGNITSNGGSLTIDSDSWVDIHKNITLGIGYLNITTSDSIGFEKEGRNKDRNAADAQITAQGTIRLTGENKSFRLNNISLNGTGSGLNIVSDVGNLSHTFDGNITVSGTVTITQNMHYNQGSWKSSYDSYWNVSSFNLKENSNFNFTKVTKFNNRTDLSNRRPAGMIFNNSVTGVNFNISKGAKASFILKPNESHSSKYDATPILFKSNISVSGGGEVNFQLLSNASGGGVRMTLDSINVSGGSKLIFNSSVRGRDAFNITKNLTINATDSTFKLEQNNDGYYTDFSHNAIKSSHNINILGGNVTLGGKGSSSTITGNITISEGANVTLQAYTGIAGGGKKLTVSNITVEGNLNLTGASADIKGNLTVSKKATFKGKTQNNLNITGNFTNNGTAEINITQGVVNLGNITNDGSLNITTHAKSGQKSIISGDITNKKGSLNITDNNSNAEIRIGGNISQKKGNLTISSDKINITKQITIKKGIVGEGSDSGGADTANLTIKTKELKLTQDLNISGFDKAEIKAKENGNLTIGDNGDGNVNAKTVTFNNVKDSKISANGHNVTLNSKVETSGNTDNTGGSSGNNAGLTINAKNVTVSNDITSHKTVNITASEKLTTKADATINATNGNVKVTTQTGDIKGQVKSTSGSVTIAASGDTLNVSNVSGNAVTITADKGKLTAQAGSTIKATTGEANITSATGTIDGTVSGGTVNVTASSGSLTVGGDAKINATEGAATLTATKGTLTTVKGSNIDANKGTLVINAKDAKLDGEASGNRTEVNATNASGSGSVTAATSSSVNITGDLNTINGLNIISENGRNTVRLRGKEIDVKYIQPGVASVEEVIEAKRVLEKVKDLSDEERETLAKLGVSAVRFVEPNNAITVNTQNEFTTRPSSQVTISEGKACFSSGNGAAVCTNVADDGQP